MSLSSSNGINTILGQFNGESFAATESFAGATTPTAYTMELPRPADTTLPQGNGYASLTISKTGAIRLAGLLGDGTPFTAQAALAQDNTAPVYASLYAKGGYIVGTVTLTPANGTIAGALNWSKPQTKGTYTPGSFSTPLTLSGATYTKSAKGTPAITSTSGIIEFTAGNLATSPLNISATLSDANRITISPPTDGLKLTITASTGLFTGSFKDPSTHATRTFKGALLQYPTGPQFGAGVFKGPTQAGSIDLFP